MSRVYIVCHATIKENTAQAFMAVCGQLVAAKHTELYILLSTPGGSVQSGVTIYHFLRGLPVKVIMHNIGNVDSIGNVIFLAGEERFACAHASFMFHGAGFDVPNGMHMKSQNLREYLDSLKADEVKMASIISSQTNFDASQATELFVEARTKNADEAVSAGIIGAIAEVNIPLGSAIVTLTVT